MQESTNHSHPSLCIYSMKSTMVY